MTPPGGTAAPSGTSAGAALAAGAGARREARGLDDEEDAVFVMMRPTSSHHARRPVIHLAATPEDVDACRRRAEFRHVMLVFRDAAHAWRGWEPLVANPRGATAVPEWNVTRVRTWRTGDGFEFVWLELGPLVPSLAGGSAHERESTPQR